MQIKILLCTDNPNLETGQGRIHRNIGLGLQSNGFQVVSIGYGGTHIEKKLVDWPVYCTDGKNQNAYFGETIFDQVVYKEQPDIVLTIGDTWNFHFIANSNLRKTFLWVGYVAIDGEIHNGGVPPTWHSTLNDMDRIVTYTQYGKQAILKSLQITPTKVEVIPHGVSTNDFYPMSDVQRQQVRNKYGIPQDSIIYTLVARNQYRKNIPEIFKAWQKFIANGEHKNALLWPHMMFKDSFGNNLNEIIKILGIQRSLIFFEQYAKAPSNLDTVSIQMMNELYNLSDIVLLISGEGMGFPLLEAIATAKPIITLNHSACGEIVKDIGELVDVDYYVTGAHSTERPYPNIDDLVNKMDKLYYDVELRERYSKLSYEQLKNYELATVDKKWSKYLSSVVNPFIGNCEHLIETIS